MSSKKLRQELGKCFKVHFFCINKDYILSYFKWINLFSSLFFDTSSHFCPLFRGNSMVRPPLSNSTCSDNLVRVLFIYAFFRKMTVYIFNQQKSIPISMNSLGTTDFFTVDRFFQDLYMLLDAVIHEGFRKHC